MTLYQVACMVKQAWSAESVPVSAEFLPLGIMEMVQRGETTGEVKDDEELVRCYFGRRFDEVDCSCSADDPMRYSLAYLLPIAQLYYLGSEILCQLTQFNLGQQNGYFKLLNLVSALESDAWIVDEKWRSLSRAQRSSVLAFLEVLKGESTIADEDYMQSLEEALTFWRLHV